MIVCFLLFVLLGSSAALQESERLELRNEAEDMFFHAYNAYMQVAWPADELMPLSCKGRYRGREPGRGDIDEALGNFSLTLIDSLDMLVVLGRIDEFEDAVLKVVETVSFDSDIVVSVFETNIRIVGGLVSGHVLAEYVRDKHGRMTWYTGELLNMALDIGNRLLPAFNSTTGLPYPRVNLRTGLKGVNSIQLTCTACAGSMILEFAALSRLSGESIYEEKASQAMDYLWRARHRQSNLVGNVLNVNTGDWVRRESGVGAGIDSYYEYVAKAYVLLGEEKYLDRWKTHYSAIMKYLNTGPLMGDVHMHHPTTNSKHFTDALGAFWPGLQVLMGDLIPAIEQHEVLYQIMKKHSFLPEAITSDFQVHWGQHFLRPEFVESTYFLYKATKDPHYLDVGKKVLKALQKHARVTCGYAAVKDVRTMVLDDRMDSFVLSETFKYLYLLFSKDDELFLDMNQFVFTTEAHLLPLSLARLSNTTVVPVTDEFHDLLQTDEEVEFAQACPSTRYMFPEHTRTADAAASVRRPLGNIVEAATPRQRVIKRRILAGDFTATDPDHIALVKQMGVNLMSLPDGRVQLLHTFANAESQEDAEEGLLFMQEMIEMSKQTQQSQDSPPKQVRLSLGDKELVLQAGPAQFGPSLTKGSEVTGMLVKAGDMKACIGGLQNGESMWGNIVLVERGDCMFIEKARVLQSLGAVGGIVMDTTEGSAAGASPIFAMSGDGSQDVSIPMVFLFMEEAKQLLQALAENPSLNVRLEEKPASQQSGLCMPKLKQDIDIETFMKILHEKDTFWFNNNNQQCNFLQYILNVVLIPTSKSRKQPNVIRIPRNAQLLPIDISKFTKTIKTELEFIDINVSSGELITRKDLEDVDKQLSQLNAELDEMKKHMTNTYVTNKIYDNSATENSMDLKGLFQSIEEASFFEDKPLAEILDKEPSEFVDEYFNQFFNEASDEFIMDDTEFVNRQDSTYQSFNQNSLPVKIVFANQASTEETDEQVSDDINDSNSLPVKIVPDYNTDIPIIVNEASTEFINYASTGMCLLLNRVNGFTNINNSSHVEFGTKNVKKLIVKERPSVKINNIQEEIDASKQTITGRKILSIQDNNKEDNFESLLEDIQNLIVEIEEEKKLEMSEEKSKDMMDNKSSLNSAVPDDNEEEVFVDDVVVDDQDPETISKTATYSVDESTKSSTNKEKEAIKESNKENSFKSLSGDIENLMVEIEEEKKLEMREETRKDNKVSLNSAVEDGNEEEVFVEVVDDQDIVGTRSKTYSVDEYTKRSTKKEKDSIKQTESTKKQMYDVESELNALETHLGKNDTDIMTKLKFVYNYLQILSGRDFDMNSEQLEFYEEIALVVYDIFDEAGLLVINTDDDTDENQNDDVAVFETVVAKIFPRYKSLSHFTKECHWLINSFTTNQEYFEGNFNLLVKLSNGVLFSYHYASKISEVILAEDDETEVYLTESLIETLRGHQPFHEQVMIFKREMERQQQQNRENEVEGIEVDFLEAEEDFRFIEENTGGIVEEDSLGDVMDDDDEYKMKFSMSSFVSNSCPEGNPNCKEEEDLTKGSCAKDDLDCNEKKLNLYTEEENIEGAIYSHLEDSIPVKIVKNFDPQLDDIPIKIEPISKKVLEDKVSSDKESEKKNTGQESNQENTEKITNKNKKGLDAHASSIHSPIVKQCYRVLEKLKKHAEAESKKQPRTEKEEVEIIRSKVKRGVKTKELIVHYSKVHKEIQHADYSDRAECVNILNASKDYISRLQAELSDTSWLNKLQLLAESGDMDLLDEVTQLIGGY